MTEDPLEPPADDDPEFAEIELAPHEPTDVDRGQALKAAAARKGA